MNTLLNVIKSLFQIEEQIQQGENERTAWVYGNTIGLDPRRYLIIISHAHDLNRRLDEEFKNSNKSDARALDRATGANIPGKILDSEQTDRIYLVKSSSGTLSFPKLEQTSRIEAIHVNDLISRRLLGFDLSAVCFKQRELLSPIKEIASVNLGRLIVPSLEESHSKRQCEALAVLREWSLGSSSVPFFVLFGVGGLGKSKLLEIYAKDMWDGFCRYEHSKLPVLVPMKGIPAGATPDLAAHIGTFPLFNRRTTASQIQVMIQSGVLIVLLDAFDEHLKFSNRSDAIRFLSMLKDAFAADSADRTAKILLTSRDYYLTTDAIFFEILGGLSNRFTLQPFDKVQRDRFIHLNCEGKISTEEASAWCESLSAVASKMSDSVDYLVGHSLFLIAFCQFICGLARSSHWGEYAAVRTPTDFEAIQSSSLFDRVIELINQREFEEKSNWDAALWRDLESKWQESPFSAEKQGTFFATLAHRILAAKDYYRDSSRSVHQSGVWIESVVYGALSEVIGIPKSRSSVDAEVAYKIEHEALQRIADFFRQHPLVDASSAGFQENSRFSFKYPAYADYFIKQYLSIRFGSLSDNLRDGKATREDILDELEFFILELFDNSIMQRATNALFFLCWDNLQLEKLGFAMVTLFKHPNKMDSECFRYLLTYSLVFVKLYSDLRKKKIDISDLCFDNMRTDDLVVLDGGDINPYLTSLSLRFCTFGNILLKGTSFEQCDLLALTVRSLSFDGTVTFRGGSLMFIADNEDTEEFDDSVELAKCMYPLGPQVTIRLIGVTIDEATLEAFRLLGQKYRNVELYEDSLHVVNFCKVSTNPTQSSAKRLIDQMMRLAKKHRRGSFGVFREKLFGRCAVPASKTTAIESYLVENQIIESGTGEMFRIKNTDYMYHPDSKFGRLFEEVEEYWEMHLDQLDRILSE